MTKGRVTKTKAQKKVSESTVNEPTDSTVSEPTVSESTATEPTVNDSSTTESKAKAKTREFEEMYSQCLQELDTCLTSLKQARRELISLNKEHKRSQRKTSKSKTDKTERKPRRPTTLFSQSLVDYVRRNLDNSELVISRKESGKQKEVDLSDLDTETPVHRTDVNKIMKKIFAKKGMADGINLRYSKDSDFVQLLVDGHDDQSEVDALKSGQYELTYFNINRFVNKHLRKLPASTA